MVGRDASRGKTREDPSTELCEFISVRRHVVSVRLGGAASKSFGGQKFRALASSILAALRRTSAEQGARCTLQLDLSDNVALTDADVVEVLAPLLDRWPDCRRLKLCRTRLSDPALEALTPWIASGHAHEVYLSELGGGVSDAAVYQLLQAIYDMGQYPTRRGAEDGPVALWLRLDRNGLGDSERLVCAARDDLGLHLRVPGRELSSESSGKEAGHEDEEGIEVDLAFFHAQFGNRSRCSARRSAFGLPTTSSTNSKPTIGQSSDCSHRSQEAEWGSHRFDSWKSGRWARSAAWGSGDGLWWPQSAEGCEGDANPSSDWRQSRQPSGWADSGKSWWSRGSSSWRTRSTPPMYDNCTNGDVSDADVWSWRYISEPMHPQISCCEPVLHPVHSNGNLALNHDISPGVAPPQRVWRPSPSSCSRALSSDVHIISDRGREGVVFTPEPELVATSSIIDQESSAIIKLDSFSVTAGDDRSASAKVASGNSNSESSTVAKLVEIVGVLVQSRESCDTRSDGTSPRRRRLSLGGAGAQTYILSPAGTSLASTPSDAAHACPPAPQVRRRASAPCSRPAADGEEILRSESGQKLTNSGVNRPCDGHAQDGEDGGELPMPPGGGSWDWPMSRQEKKARVTMIDRDVMLADQRVLRERITELVGDKS